MKGFPDALERQLRRCSGCASQTGARRGERRLCPEAILALGDRAASADGPILTMKLGDDGSVADLVCDCYVDGPGWSDNYLAPVEEETSAAWNEHDHVAALCTASAELRQQLECAGYLPVAVSGPGDVLAHYRMPLDEFAPILAKHATEQTTSRLDEGGEPHENAEVEEAPQAE